MATLPTSVQMKKRKTHSSGTKKDDDDDSSSSSDSSSSNSSSSSSSSSSSDSHINKKKPNKPIGQSKTVLAPTVEPRVETPLNPRYIKLLEWSNAQLNTEIDWLMNCKRPLIQYVRDVIKSYAINPSSITRSFEEFYALLEKIVIQESFEKEESCRALQTMFQGTMFQGTNGEKSLHYWNEAGDNSDTLKMIDKKCTALLNDHVLRLESELLNDCARLIQMLNANLSAVQKKNSQAKMERIQSVRGTVQMTLNTQRVNKLCTIFYHSSNDGKLTLRESAVRSEQLEKQVWTDVMKPAHALCNLMDKSIETQSISNTFRTWCNQTQHCAHVLLNCTKLPLLFLVEDVDYKYTQYPVFKLLKHTIDAAMYESIEFFNLYSQRELTIDLMAHGNDRLKLQNEDSQYALRHYVALTNAIFMCAPLVRCPVGHVVCLDVDIGPTIKPIYIHSPYPSDKCFFAPENVRHKFSVSECLGELVELMNLCETLHVHELRMAHFLPGNLIRTPDVDDENTSGNGNVTNKWRVHDIMHLTSLRSVIPEYEGPQTEHMTKQLETLESQYILYKERVKNRNITDDVKKYLIAAVKEGCFGSKINIEKWVFDVLFEDNTTIDMFSCIIRFVESHVMTRREDMYGGLSTSVFKILECNCCVEFQKRIQGGNVSNVYFDAKNIIKNVCNEFEDLQALYTKQPWCFFISGPMLNHVECENTVELIKIMMNVGFVGTAPSTETEMILATNVEYNNFPHSVVFKHVNTYGSNLQLLPLNSENAHNSISVLEKIAPIGQVQLFKNVPFPLSEFKFGPPPPTHRPRAVDYKGIEMQLNKHSGIGYETFYPFLSLREGQMYKYETSAEFRSPCVRIMDNIDQQMHGLVHTPPSQVAQPLTNSTGGGEDKKMSKKKQTAVLQHQSIPMSESDEQSPQRLLVPEMLTGCIWPLIHFFTHHSKFYWNTKEHCYWPNSGDLPCKECGNLIKCEVNMETIGFFLLRMVTSYKSMMCTGDKMKVEGYQLPIRLAPWFVAQAFFMLETYKSVSDFIKYPKSSGLNDTLSSKIQTTTPTNNTASASTGNDYIQTLIYDTRKSFFRLNLEQQVRVAKLLTHYTYEDVVDICSPQIVVSSKINPELAENNTSNKKVSPRQLANVTYVRMHTSLQKNTQTPLVTLTSMVQAAEQVSSKFGKFTQPTEPNPMCISCKTIERGYGNAATNCLIRNVFVDELHKEPLRSKYQIAPLKDTILCGTCYLNYLQNIVTCLKHEITALYLDEFLTKYPLAPTASRDYYISGLPLKSTATVMNAVQSRDPNQQNDLTIVGPQSDGRKKDYTRCAFGNFSNEFAKHIFPPYAQELIAATLAIPTKKTDTFLSIVESTSSKALPLIIMPPTWISFPAVFRDHGFKHDNNQQDPNGPKLTINPWHGIRLSIDCFFKIISQQVPQSVVKTSKPQYTQSFAVNWDGARQVVQQLLFPKK